LSVNLRSLFLHGLPLDRDYRYRQRVKLDIEARCPSRRGLDGCAPLRVFQVPECRDDTEEAGTGLKLHLQLSAFAGRKLERFPALQVLGKHRIAIVVQGEEVGGVERANRPEFVDNHNNR